MNWIERGTDRRSGCRFEVLGTLRGSAVSVQRVQVRNIGPGGALIESHWPLPLDARVTLKWESALDQVDAHIRHINKLTPTSYLIGLEFIDPDHAVFERLDGALASLG